MALELKEYIKGLVACAWCGNVRDKKVELSGENGRTVVCRRHFMKNDGTLVNEPTADAIICVRSDSHVRR